MLDVDVDRLVVDVDVVLEVDVVRVVVAVKVVVDDVDGDVLDVVV